MTAVSQDVVERSRAGAAFDLHERELVIERLEVCRTGRYSNGSEWTLFTVFANELDGTPIPVILRTFDSLTGTERVEFEPYMDKGFVSHITLKRAKTAVSIRERRREARAAVMGESPARDDEPSVKDRLSAAEARIDALEGRLALLASLLGQDDE